MELVVKYWMINQTVLIFWSTDNLGLTTSWSSPQISDVYKYVWSKWPWLHAVNWFVKRKHNLWDVCKCSLKEHTRRTVFSLIHYHRIVVKIWHTFPQKRNVWKISVKTKLLGSHFTTSNYLAGSYIRDTHAQTENGFVQMFATVRSKSTSPHQAGTKIIRVCLAAKLKREKA